MIDTNIEERRLKEKDIANQKFGMLTAIRLDHLYFTERLPYKRSVWLFKCDCGNETYKERVHVTSGNTKSCGCLPLRRGNNNYFWKGYGEIGLTHWSDIKHGAKRRNMEFNIKIEQAWDLFLKQDRRCALTNLVLSFARRGDIKNSTASLDRIDSDKPYNIDNIQWIHKDLNVMKWDFPQDHFINMCKLVALKNS